jgi:hypothetical protein
MSLPTPMNLRSPLVAGVLIAAVILAVSLLRWTHGGHPNFPVEHSNVAYSLASGMGYGNPYGVVSGPTAWIPPAVPIAYAGAIELSRALRLDERALIVALNFLVTVAAVYLILRFCLRAWRPRSRQVFCAVFLAYGLLDQNFLVSTGAITEAECALLLAGLCAAASKPGGLMPWILLFTANGLLAVTHPGLALAGMLASVGVGLAGLTSVGAFARSAAFAALAGAAATSIPWTLRNYAVFHQWLPGKSNGCFELVVSHQDTDDGILADSALVGHPSTNPRLLNEYARLGEREFLKPYRRQAAEIVTDDFGRYCLFCLNRLYDAVCYAKSPSDIELLSVRLPTAEAARLVGKRLILQCAGAPNFFWARSTRPGAAELADLTASGVDRPDAVLADWARAQGAIRRRVESPASLLTGFLWSGFPSLCFLAAAAAGRFAPPRLVLIAGSIYLIALLPNVLITHDVRHQANFGLLFAVMAAGAAEVMPFGLTRRRDRAGGLPMAPA